MYNLITGKREYLLKYRLAVGIMMPSAPDFYRPSVSEHSLIAVINSQSQKACENSPPFKRTSTFCRECGSWRWRARQWLMQGWCDFSRNGRGLQICLSQKQLSMEGEIILEQCQPISAVSNLCSWDCSQQVSLTELTSPRHKRSISPFPSRADGSTAIFRHPQNRLGLRCLAGCYQPTHLLIQGPLHSWLD